MALINYWRLNGDFNDAVGSLNLTAYGSPTSKPNAGINGCYDFNGTTQYASSASAVTITSAATYSLLIYPHTIATKSFFCFGNSAGNRLDSFLLENTWLTTYVSDTVGIRYYSSNPVAIVANKWQHVVMTRASINSDAPIFYIDGKQCTATQITNTGTVGAISQKLTIGRYGDLADYYFDGLIDDVRVYNTALTPAEVKNLYAYYKGYF
jgi:hypothetical protein